MLKMLLFSVAQSQFFSAVTLKQYVIRKRLCRIGLKPLACLWLAIQSSSENKVRLIQQKSSDWFNYLTPCISDTFKKAKNSKIDSSAGGAHSVLPASPAEHLLGFRRKVITGKCLRSITLMNSFQPQPLRTFSLCC